MLLLDLPPELLSGIIDLTVPGDLENFAITCKTVYGCARSQIARHNALKRRWKHTTNSTSNRRGDTLRIIYEISQDPIIAQYIETLCLWDQRSTQEIGHVMDDTYDFREHEDALQDMKYMLQRAENFAGAAGVYVDDWWDAIRQADNNPDEDGVDDLSMTVGLLSLLPRLKTLQLPNFWDSTRVTEDFQEQIPTMEALVGQWNGKPGSAGPLKSLDTLLPFAEEGYHRRVDLQVLQPFLGVKSLRNLFAVSCVAVMESWDSLDLPWPSPIRSSLTRVEFVSCCIDAHGLEVLLRQMPDLTIFKYSHQTKAGGLENDWNPGEFAQILAKYCGSRLTELALTIDELDGDIVNGLSSFHGFSALKDLEVDLAVFVGPPIESGQCLGRNARIPEGDIPWAHEDIPCLGDMLAPNIERVQLNTDYPEPSKQVLKSLIKNIRDRRCDKLINLKSMIIRQYRSGTAKDIADQHDCTLEVFDEDVPAPRQRAMMPSWKRQFDHIVGGIVTYPEP